MSVVSLSGISKDEIFGQFFGALEKAHFFKTMPDGTDDEEQLDRATRAFHSAIAVWYSLVDFCHCTITPSSH